MIYARFLTASRADLFAMTRLLCTAVTTAGLPDDAAAPLVVAVNGGLESGKKIVTDAAVAALFDEGSARMDGKSGYDEYWRGTRNGAPYGVDYIDMAYPYRHDYSTRLGSTDRRGRQLNNDMTGKYNDFTAQRDTPGITFVQNAATFNARAGISIYIEDYHVQYMVGYAVPRLHTMPQSLKRAFAGAHGADPWARLVEIEVRDPRLLESPAFNDSFMAFAPTCRLPRWAKPGLRDRFREKIMIDQEKDPRGIVGDVKIFGRDGFPQMTLAA